MKSLDDTCDWTRAHPKTDTDDPARMKPLRDREEPRATELAEESNPVRRVTEATLQPPEILENPAALRVPVDEDPDTEVLPVKAEPHAETEAPHRAA